MLRKVARAVATIRTGLAMNDQMTSVIKGVYSSINMTIRAMESLSDQMDEGFDPSAIRAARAAVQQTEAAIKNLPPPIDDAEKKQKMLNQRFKEGEGAVGGLLGQLGKVAAVLAPFLAVGKVVKGGFDRLIGIDTAEAKLRALGHTTESVAEIMDNAIESVTGTAFRMEEAVNTAAAAVAAGVQPGKQLERYLTLTADAAAIAGSNLGEMGAIFNKITTRGRIQAEEMNQLLDRGVPIVQMLADQMGVASDEISTLISKGMVSSDIFLNAIERGFGGAAQVMGESSFMAVIDNIGAALSRIGAGFLKGTDEGTGFFGQLKPLMVDVLNLLRSFESQAAVIGDAVGRVFQYLIDNIETVKMVLLGLGVAAAVVAAIWLVKWLIAAWPVVAIIAGITLLMVILNKLGVTVDQVVGFITGIFNMLFALIYNQVARLWNRFASFAEFFANVFNHPVYSAKKLFVDFVNSTLEIVKKVAEAIDWVFGSDLAGKITSLQDSMNEWLGEMPEGYKVIARMEEKSIVDSFKNGYEKGSNFVNGIANALGNLDGDLGAFHTEVENINRIDEVGKIKDSVDISSEDLKTMRELAEMKSIQNFVTLQPNFNVQTGDIHENADFDVLVAKLEEELQEALTASAEGVYA